MSMHRVGSSRRASGRAFTLIELLVVISIVALLVALILPALQQAREAAYIAKCLSGTRQVAIAAKSYQDAERGYYPSYLNGEGADLVNRVFPYSVTRVLVKGAYLYQDAFTNKTCPYGPAAYSDSHGSYYYGTTPGVVSIGLNEMLQSSYSYVNPPAFSFWSPPGPGGYATPGYYPVQGPFVDGKWKRIRTRPDLVMSAGCCITPGAGQVSSMHTVRNVDPFYFPGQVIPVRHFGKGLPWTFYDGHGQFIPVEDVAPSAGYVYTASPYLLWEWTWRTFYHAPGMDI